MATKSFPLHAGEEVPGQAGVEVPVAIETPGSYGLTGVFQASDHSLCGSSQSDEYPFIVTEGPSISERATSTTTLEQAETDHQVRLTATVTCPTEEGNGPEGQAMASAAGLAGRHETQGLLQGEQGDRGPEPSEAHPGLVLFRSDTGIVCLVPVDENGVAEVTVSGLVPGEQHVFTARYLGNRSCSRSVSNPVTVEMPVPPSRRSTSTLS